MPKIIAHGVPVESIKKLVDNYCADIASDQAYDFTVPTGKKWKVYGGFTERAGTTVFAIEVFNSDDEEIIHSPQSDSGSTDIDWGIFQDKDTLLDGFQIPFPLTEGMYVRYRYWSNPYASKVSLLVEEEDM